jgi:hypothetical protein
MCFVVRGSVLSLAVLCTLSGAWLKSFRWKVREGLRGFEGIIQPRPQHHSFAQFAAKWSPYYLDPINPPVRDSYTDAVDVALKHC